MFDLARDVTWVGGIVACCPLDDEHRARARLEELRTKPKLRGVQLARRHPGFPIVVGFCA